MRDLRGVRLAAALNAREVGSARAVIGTDLAHHVVDPDGLLGLEISQANALDAALVALVALESERWMPALPAPGALGGLRGPSGTNQAALEAGQVVVAATAGLALVPQVVGPAVQWLALPANRPQLPDQRGDAEQALSEAILGATAALRRLDVAAGSRPEDPPFWLPAAYSDRARAAAERAARLLVACEAALAGDGGAISSYEVAERRAPLRQVRDAARDALCSAVTWL